jgi:hypothetical protein
MIYYLIGLIVSGLFIAHGIYTAPEMDENTGKVIKPGKKLSNLWRKRK